MNRRFTFIVRYALAIGCGVALDYLGSLVASTTGAPLFLDTFGTIAVAACAGPAPGVIVGLLANLIAVSSDPANVYFAGVNVIIAVLASAFANRGAFTRVAPTVLLAVTLALLCSVLDTGLSWTLAGMDLGTGTPRAMAETIRNATGWNSFFAQLSASSTVDFADKLLTIALLFPFMRRIPERLTRMFDESPLQYYRMHHAKSDAWNIELPEFHRKRSLATYTTLTCVAICVTLGAACLIVSSNIYDNTASTRYAAEGSDIDQLAASHIDADMVNTYLEQGAQTAGYAETLEQLRSIDRISESTAYIYVYQMQLDGAHVVFDTDEDARTAGTLGQVLAYEDAFNDQHDALLAGNAVSPVISNDEYGWFMSVYEPLHDSAGRTVAYVCADIDMGDVLADRVSFMAKVSAIVFAATVIIIVFAVGTIRRRIVDPVNRLSIATDSFAFDNDTERAEDLQNMRNLNIRTGDEIENLYNAVVQMTQDATSHMGEIDEQNRRIQHQIKVIRRMQNNTIMSFAELTDARDKITGGHIRRTARYMDLLANAALEQGVYPDELTPPFVQECIRSAPLHDIGKIAISDTLLNKPGTLTDEEYRIMQTHAAKGGKILQSVLTGINDEDSDYLDTAVSMATHHHEHWDGSGYPDGLHGLQIPLCARLMAIVDVFDALYSKRSYKKGYSFDECMDIIENENGKAFDPVLCDVFLGIRDQVRRAAESLTRYDS